MLGAYRPTKPRLWAWLALGTPLLLIVALCTLLLLDSLTGVFTGSVGVRAGEVSNYFTCVGGVGLLLAVLCAVAVSEFRAWSATRDVKLTVYQEGFTYEDGGRVEVCRWEEIGKVKYGYEEIITKALRTRVRVIRSVVRKDGAVIKLARTLDLRRVTEVLTAAREKAR
jgi:hypothetical protein